MLEHQHQIERLNDSEIVVERSPLLVDDGFGCRKLFGILLDQKIGPHVPLQRFEQFAWSDSPTRFTGFGQPREQQRVEFVTFELASGPISGDLGRSSACPPPEHLRAPKHGSAEPICSLPTGSFTAREQSGDARLAMLVDANATVTSMMVYLDLQQVTIEIDPDRSHIFFEDVGLKPPLGIRQVEEHGIVIGSATRKRFIMDPAVEMNCCIATADRPMECFLFRDLG